MEDNFKLDNCNQNEVLSIKDKVFKISKIQETIKTIFCGNLANALYEQLTSYGVDIDPGGNVIGNKFYRYNSKFFKEGIECEILKFNSEGWQKGKFRIKVSIEFCPDEPEIEETTEIKEPESPLDDLRRMINDATS
ncbi:KGK domain-containing protein [Cylindrospermum stagnale]|uniref:KGK domain-containing protein n=1 Tax=Cylindrospermum stagnale TaxID=142864 RepID=UPI0002D45C7D|nr:KGK domain-containing protein [Cylindrospermum stagnale]